MAGIALKVSVTLFPLWFPRGVNERKVFAKERNNVICCSKVDRNTAFFILFMDTSVTVFRNSMIYIGTIYD